MSERQRAALAMSAEGPGWGGSHVLGEGPFRTCSSIFEPEYGIHPHLKPVEQEVGPSWYKFETEFLHQSAGPSQS